ncbi:zinc ribbon domain-containing protein [Diplocloster modestus]|uniref:Zinc-ribbon domain-containing protein n=1 Tax=Diplocloster modestus TaxID=2850322 RepID=A0ABS6KD72_9FIRM|nr:zinc ribbon domain-containing protein [Diplocloster modestus]MBU9728455.1 zinc-ribbon domain-containing protein [Diplocloster modestus]
MKKCPHCGVKLEKDAPFCGACGKPVLVPQKNKKTSGTSGAAGFRMKRYAHPSGGFLFAALLSLRLFPYLLNAGMVMLFKNLLPVLLPLTVSFLGIVAGWALLACAVLRVRGEGLSTNKIAACALELFARGGGAALLVLFCFRFIDHFITYLYGQTELLHPVVMLIFQLILPLGSSALIAFLIIRGFATQRRAGVFLAAAGLILAAKYVAPMAAGLVLAILPGMSESLSGMTVGYILTALLQWLVLLPLLMESQAQGQKEDAPAQKSNRMSIVTAGALAVLCVVSAIQVLPQNPKDAVKKQISEMVAEGDRFAADGDLLSASACYRYAIARRDAWRVVLSKEGSLWGSIQQTYNDEAVRLLQVEADHSQDSHLYSWLLTQDCPGDYYAYYLDSIRETAKTDGEAAKRQHDILLDCMQNGIFTGSFVTRSALSDRQAKKLLEEINAMDENLDSRRSVMLYSDLAANGGVLTLDLTKRAVALAEQYPTNLALQGSAMELGCSYTDDPPQDYHEAAAAAAKRFDTLYEKQNPNPAPHDYEAEKVMVAFNLMKIQKIDEAKKILSVAAAKSDSIALRYLLATCHYRASEYEVCAEMAEAIYAGNPGHQQALGLAMLARGLNGQMTESLTYALELSEQARSGNPVIGDTMLSTYARGMAGTYISRKQFPLRYGDLSDADKARLEGDPLLGPMVLSSWQAARREYDDSLISAEQALAVCPEWPSLYYLKGNILFEQKIYREAADAYGQSVLLNQGNPSAWFMLGQALDRLELYDLSANAFQHVLELVPNSDHEVDKYGLALHADWALQDLQDYVGEEKKP